MSSHTDRPTMPPGADDAQAARFAQKIEEIERARVNRTTSGLFRALAESLAETLGSR